MRLPKIEIATSSLWCLSCCCFLFWFWFWGFCAVRFGFVGWRLAFGDDGYLLLHLPSLLTHTHSDTTTTLIYLHTDTGTEVARLANSEHSAL